MSLIGLEWGTQGITACPADVYVIVDVLSFSTCVDIALGRGATVLPFRFKDERAAAFAREQQAWLAVDRGAAGFSLSPVSLLELPAATRLVLPSPNGATLSLLTGSAPTVCACLRNAAAVAEWIKRANFGRIQLVPAGERWPEGSLRPALEDWLGAGAVLAHFDVSDHAFGPEAEVARAAYLAQEGDLAQLIRACPSGQELIQRGFAQDVELALQPNVSSGVPVFAAGTYRLANS
ncbi:MAG TPA: 2-phosphosulfolactate phosphatase [Candidatus Obscuribacterales bacterium]